MVFIIIIFAVFALIVKVFFFSKKETLFTDESINLFKSSIKIKLPEKSKKSLFEQSFHLLKTIDQNYNSYSPVSHIHNINKNAGFFTNVDETTIYLLEKIKEYSLLLDGEYDITIMPLLRLWGFYSERHSLPSIDEINLSKKHVNYEKIKISSKEKKIKIDSEQEIITGSFIKSFGADVVKKYLSSSRINDALINISSSTITGLNKRKKFWKVIIEDPDDETKDLFLLKLSNKSISVSGNNNSFISINGENYGHIISPKTGFPGKNKLLAVISSSAFKSDVFSTGLYNFSGCDFIQKINSIDDLEGVLINEKREIFYSENFKDFILENYTK